MTLFDQNIAQQGFRQLGARSTLEDFIRERRNDAAVIDNILEFNKRERNRTGLRSIPSSSNDTAAGDLEGDYIDDFSNGYRYEFVNNDGTLQWIRFTITTSF